MLRLCGISFSLSKRAELALRSQAKCDISLSMRYLLLLCSIFLLFGGTETKPKVDDYEVHAKTNNIAIGAEYTVHSFSRGEQMFIANDYLVVEVALFPPKETTFEVIRGDFSLRINGRKDLDAAEPKLVVAQMEHPEWQPPRDGLHAEGGGSIGNVGVVINAPQANPNPFPTSRTSGPPPPVEIPKDNPSGVTKQQVDPSTLLLATALEEGQHHAPISGFLYFPYRGNLKSIKTLELLYHDAVLKLR